MATLAELWEEPSTKIPPSVQAERDKEALAIKQSELVKAQQRLKQGDPRAQGDVDALIREMGGKVPPRTSEATPRAGETLADLWEATPPAGAPETKVEQQPSKVRDLIGQILSKTQEAKQQLGAATASLADVTIGGIIPGVAGPVTYAGARALGKTPEEAAALEQKVVSATEKPFGKALGVTEMPTYKGEASRQIMDFIGQNINKGAEWIAQKTGLPVADVQNMMGTAMVGAAPAVPKVAAAAGRAGEVVAKPFREAAAELEVGKPAAPAAPAGSLGSAAAQKASQIQELASRLPENEARQLLATDPAKVDIAAAERRAVGHKFGIELTKGEAKQDLSLLGDEFNAKKESPELQRRLAERSEKLFRGLDDIKERTAPDIYTSDKTELGQRVIDTLQAKDAQRRAEISGLYKRLEEANAGALPIDTGTLLNNINSRLAQKMRTRYAPAELMDTIKDAASRGSMTFEEFENLRSIAAEEIRSSKDGNKRMAANIIRDELENMPLSTDNAQIKALADQARTAAKARFDLLEKNPAYKAAVRDTRSEADLAAGLESVGADKFLQQFVHSDTKQASTANLKRLMAELSDQPDALQALRAGTIEHFREKATMAGNNFGQAGYNKRLAALRGKVDRIFAGDPALQDLRELGQLATWTEHRRPMTGANVSESGNVVMQGMRKAAEAGIQAKTGVPVGMIKGYIQNKKRETELRKMVEPGAGITND